MIYCSIDIETAGLDPAVSPILSVGIVLENTETAKYTPINELPSLHIGIAHSRIVGDIVALAMNAELIKTLSEYTLNAAKINSLKYKEFDYIVYRSADIVPLIVQFLRTHIPPKDLYKLILTDGRIQITCAGKNFASFDLKFLMAVPDLSESLRFSHRDIDPALMYLRFDTDIYPPSLSTCKSRLLESYPGAFESDVVSHTAVDDARDVIQLIRYTTDLYGHGL